MGYNDFDALPALIYFPWRLFFPAMLICLTILAFNVIGDGLRDALDPRLVNRSERMEKILEVKDLNVISNV